MNKFGEDEKAGQESSGKVSKTKILEIKKESDDCEKVMATPNHIKTERSTQEIVKCETLNPETVVKPQKQT